eukprot:c45507_g1_i1 orf=79-249(+)
MELQLHKYSQQDNLALMSVKRSWNEGATDRAIFNETCLEWDLFTDLLAGKFGSPIS